MAIVGLHNVPVLESSILRESQPPPSSSSSGRRVNQRRVTTRASSNSILQMWRELEDECVVNRGNESGGRSRLQSPELGNRGAGAGAGGGGVEDSSESENGSVNNSESVVGVANENDDHQSMTSEQSQDLGDVERERVRQIFREWMNSGVTPQGAHLSRGSRAPWLGETERERVRIVREWIQMTSQQREAYVGNRDEQVTEIGSQIERVRDGQVVNRDEGQGENSRREIRRLCGRQALLDLLAKKEQERRIELQGLEEIRPVSSFAHRNRIQSLLRIRCFQNTRSDELRRSSSAAENELGLLRQRQTVSGLREGFLSWLDNSAHAQASVLSSDPCNNDTDGIRDDQPQPSSTIEVLDCVQEQNDSGDGNETSLIDANQLPESSIGETDSRQLVAEAEARLDHALDNDGDRRQETAAVSQLTSSSDDRNPVLNSQESSRSDDSGEFGDIRENHDPFLQQHTNNEQEIDIHNQSNVGEGHVVGDVNGQESSIPAEDWQEQVVEYEEREWEGSVLSNQWRDDDQVETNRQHWLHDGDESSQGGRENDSREQNDAQEEWHENGSQETPRDWLGITSGPGATSSGRVDTYYFSDDDNVYNMELRELLNRRRVSSLLHSGFRESLDQLIQSYVERQTQGPDDWELHEMSPPPFAARDEEQLGTDHNEESGAVGTRRTLPLPPPPPPQGYWGQALHHTNWSRHNARQRPGTDWEIINDLRIDMARLQQRMNNMQRMLEACMDMQLELQRSVRQEVSAALNRSINPSESLESILPKESVKWDRVRKGVCCICSDSNIDSLLYRCGHMCTCTKCADVLVEGNGKCPMCQAPVIEVIHAYFIQ